MKNNLLYVMLLCYSFNMLAQQDAWVYFTDKENVQESIDNPISILTQEAIDRKSKYNIAIDARDVPVNETYISQLKNATGITVMAKSKWFNAVHVRGSETDINNLQTTFVFVDHVEFADKSLNTSKAVKKRQESKQESVQTMFNYGNTANQVEMIHVNDLHLSDYTGTGMTVAVIDAGFPGVGTIAAFQRLRDAGNIKGTYDFVQRDTDVYTNTSSNHGTLVLSTMAGYVENQYVGTAPDASYYLFITEDNANENPVEESYWVEAVERADSLGVDVINTSLGYGDFYDNVNYRYVDSDYDGQTIYITKGANIAAEKGVLLVNSAGNEDVDGLNAPADSPYVFTVGAVDTNGDYASFSSIGSNIQPTQKPDVVAQGKGSAVVFQNNVIGIADGTSFSSPILAGGLVCLWQALPDKTNAEIMQLVRESSSQYTNPDYQLGYGIPNLQLALNTVLSVSELDNVDTVRLYPNPVRDAMYFQLSEDNNEYEVSIYNTLGELVAKNIISFRANKIDTSLYSKGVYIVTLKGKDRTSTFKLIKQ